MANIWPSLLTTKAAGIDSGSFEPPLFKILIARRGAEASMRRLLPEHGRFHRYAEPQRASHQQVSPRGPRSQASPPYSQCKRDRFAIESQVRLRRTAFPA